MNSDPWFNLALHPKHIARGYQRYVRSILLYGFELLNHDNRVSLYELDAKLLNTLFRKLLKLCRGRLSEKYRWRLQLALGIQTFHMDLEALVANRVDNWISRPTSPNTMIIHCVDTIPRGRIYREYSKFGGDASAATSVGEEVHRDKHGMEDEKETGLGTVARGEQRDEFR